MSRLSLLPEMRGFCWARPLLARTIRFMHADTTLGFSVIASRSEGLGASSARNETVGDDLGENPCDDIDRFDKSARRYRSYRQIRATISIVSTNPRDDKDRIDKSARRYRSTNTIGNDIDVWANSYTDAFYLATELRLDRGIRLRRRDSEILYNMYIGTTKKINNDE